MPGAKWILSDMNNTTLTTPYIALVQNQTLFTLTLLTILFNYTTIILKLVVLFGLCTKKVFRTNHFCFLLIYQLIVECTGRTFYGMFMILRLFCLKYNLSSCLAHGLSCWSILSPAYLTETMYPVMLVALSFDRYSHRLPELLSQEGLYDSNISLSDDICDFLIAINNTQENGMLRNKTIDTCKMLVKTMDWRESMWGKNLPSTMSLGNRPAVWPAMVKDRQSQLTDASAKVEIIKDEPLDLLLCFRFYKFWKSRIKKILGNMMQEEIHIFSKQ
uniref:Uncharacterized protein n=1 Tax=Romanomermis culicivorax TaxID=13658 RepID=A0A915J791_ROMCU